MSLFDDVVAEVYTKTNRPDLVAETISAIKKATLKLHQSDFYPKDLEETGLEFTAPAYLQSLTYRDLFPRFRKLEYLRKYDAAGDTPGDFFTIITPAQIFDDYNIQRENVVYLAGATLEIRSDTEDAHMLIGYYTNPILTPATYDSWIAQDHLYAVVAEAARTICSDIGLEERAARMEKDAAEQFILLKNSNI